MLPAPTSSAPFMLIDGITMLKHRSLRGFVLIPLMINVLVFIGLFYWGLDTAFAIQAKLLAWLPDVLHIVSWLVWPFFLLTGLLIMVYGFTTLASILAAPFNAFLCEKVEQLYGFPSNNTPLTLDYLGQTVKRTMIREWQKLRYSVKWWLILLVVLFIPVVNVISPVITAWLLAIQYLDLSADNHDLPFTTVISRVKKRPMKTVSFGFAVALMSMIPVLNVLVVSAAACAGTVLWHQHYHSDA